MLPVAVTSREVETSTRERLLLSAKHLFARNGLAVRVVDIAKLAEANIAAINYHFGNKDKLLQFVLEAACAEVVQERLRLLREVENRETVPTVREIIAIWLAPAVKKLCDGEIEGPFLSQLTRIVSEVRSEQHLGFGASRLLLECNDEFVRVLARLRPELSRETLEWRLSGMIGTLVFVSEKVWFAASDPSAEARFCVSMAEILAFLVAGFEAPGPESSSDWMTEWAH